MSQETFNPSKAADWAWLFPLAYGLHIAEEYWFHFTAYVGNLSGRQISNSHFLIINAVLWLLMVAIVVFVRARPARAWLVVTLATVLGINAVLHIGGSLLTLSYSPGTVTAALLFVPLVGYALRQVLPHVSRPVALRAAALGAAIHVGVVILAGEIG